MARFSFDAGDLEALASHLETNADGIGDRAWAVVRAATIQGWGLSIENAPVDTGFLRNSITASVSGGPGAGFAEGEWGPTAHYGIFVEFGTSRMAPQPFVAPAFHAVVPAFLAAAAEISDPLNPVTPSVSIDPGWM